MDSLISPNIDLCYFKKDRFKICKNSAFVLICAMITNNNENVNGNTVFKKVISYHLYGTFELK